MEVSLDALSLKAAEQLMGLMEEYFDMGYYMSPLDNNVWLLIPIDILEESPRGYN